MGVGGGGEGGGGTHVEQSKTDECRDCRKTVHTIYHAVESQITTVTSLSSSFKIGARGSG